jgi:hypothetical protein
LFAGRLEDGYDSTWKCSAAAPSMRGRGETARKRVVGSSRWTDMASRGVLEAKEGKIWQPFSQTNCDRDEQSFPENQPTEKRVGILGNI